MAPLFYGIRQIRMFPKIHTGTWKVEYVLHQSTSIPFYKCELAYTTTNRLLTLYTDNVPYEACELNEDFRKSIQSHRKTHGHELVIENDAKPIKSGMIALVYEGQLNAQRVVIKVMRTGVRVRLEEALKK